MRFWNPFRPIQRRFWHICYECLRNNGNVAEEAIFYYNGPPHQEVGRKWIKCPRCGALNTRSFQFLKEQREDSALFGLERIVKKNPRRRFEVKPSA